MTTPFRLPPLTPRLQRNLTWRYHFSGEFPLARAAVQHARWRRFRAAAEMLAGLPRPSSLLDVGCGTGESTLYLSRALGVAEATGCDESGDGVWFARELAAANGVGARFLVTGVTRLPVPAGRVGLVVSFEMLEHLPAWRSFLTEARRVLEPGGYLLFTTPNAASIVALVKSARRRLRRSDRAQRWDGGLYEAFLSEETLRHGLESAGFAVLDVRRVAFVIAAQPDWSLAAVRALEPWLERTPGLRRLAATTVVLARAL